LGDDPDLQSFSDEEQDFDSSMPDFDGMDFDMEELMKQFNKMMAESGLSLDDLNLEGLDDLDLSGLGGAFANTEETDSEPIVDDAELNINEEQNFKDQSANPRFAEPESDDVVFQGVGSDFESLLDADSNEEEDREL